MAVILIIIDMKYEIYTNIIFEIKVRYIDK